MEHMQKVTNINHVKFDIHTLDNMEVTRTFMFNLHIQTVAWAKDEPEVQPISACSTPQSKISVF